MFPSPRPDGDDHNWYHFSSRLSLFGGGYSIGFSRVYSSCHCSTLGPKIQDIPRSHLQKASGATWDVFHQLAMEISLNILGDFMDMIGDVVKPMPSDRGWFVYHLFLLELGTVYCWLCLVNCWVENDMTKFGGAFGAPFLKSRLRNELQVACRKTQQLFLGGASPIFNRHAPNYIQLYTSARNIGYNIYIYIHSIYIYPVYTHIHSTYIYILAIIYIHTVYIYIYT